MRDNLVVVMDDIAAITVAKDTSFALLLAGQRRGYRLLYLNEDQLFLEGGRCLAQMREIRVMDDPGHWFELGDEVCRPLGSDDVVMMRADPPVDAGYLYATYLLDRAEAAGALVINRPQALRDFNEKLAIARFPALMAPTLVSANAEQLKNFVNEQGKAVLKPLDGMGGRGIFLAERGDANLNVIIETLTADGRALAMAQAFVPEIEVGDKRILMVGGEPVPYLLARIPGQSDFRGNLARGGRGEGQPLSPADLEIARTVGPVLKANGIAFAGLDVIGDRLTEINVTSPTCVRELDAQFGLDIAGDLFAAVDP